MLHIELWVDSFLKYILCMSFNSFLVSIVSGEKSAVIILIFLVCKESFFSYYCQDFLFLSFATV